MKAKEYSEKYKYLSNSEIKDDVFINGLKELFSEMKGEMFELADKRGVKTFKGLEALEKEFNIKGNKISELLGNTIKKDWFKCLFDELKEKFWWEENKKNEQIYRRRRA